MSSSNDVIGGGATGRGLTRRQVLEGALVAGGAVGFSTLLAACNPSSTTAGAAAGSGKFPSHPNWKFVFVCHVTTNPFFVPTQYGLEDMGSVLGVQFQWTGSQNSVVSEMVDAMNTAINAKVDGIGVCIVDPQAFNDPVTRATAAGIPVIAFNADAPASSNNGRLSYVGQDLFASGQAMGNHIAQLVDSGPVVIFIATPGSLNIQPRADGAKAAIAASGKNITVDVVATGAQVADELNAIEAYYQGHQGVKGMFAVDAGSTESVAQVMDTHGLVAKGVHAGGYDLTPKTVQLLQKGALDFTIDQQPYLQGAYTITELFMYKLSGGLAGPASCNTGLKFVTKDTVGPYASTKSRFEGSAADEKVIGG